MQLFIIPGNPPAVHYYKLWAEEIKRDYPGFSIYISPYPYIPHKDDSPCYLHQIAEIHGKQLLAFHQTVQKKVTIIGHSLGAWMALSMLKEHHAIIEDSFLLYPFLQRPSVRGRAILKFIRLLYQIPRIEGLFLGSRGILERFSEELKHVTDEEICTSLVLSYHEQAVIASSLQIVEIPQPLREKLHMIYCDNDTWCSQDTVQEMEKWISCEKVDGKHCFITSQEQRALVLNALLRKKTHVQTDPFLKTDI